ncbi:CBO0543 family protein [Sutcliffiella deserti]|uniref:CBO0543 family protein n=1 Tax=Sutcliffiella deserti TaxID=2875501 RepID=UPI001CBF75AA|nr:CBO0543 family protein [Sutcliffiella deserti]
MYLLLVLVVWTLFAYKFIDWHRVKDQYPTVLFFIAINMTYNTIYHDQLLWAFQGITAEWLNHTTINLFFTFYICPVTLIIFFQRMPEARNAKIIYVAVWVIFYTIIEALFAHKAMYVYGEGWNSWQNIWLNAILFMFLLIHYRKPAVALILAIPAAALFYFMFPAPLY